MSDTVIRVEGLSKKYVIGHRRNGSDGLRHVLQDKLTAPLRWAKSKAQSAKRRPLSSGLTSDLRLLTAGMISGINRELGIANCESFKRAEIRNWKFDILLRNSQFCGFCATLSVNEDEVDKC